MVQTNPNYHSAQVSLNAASTAQQTVTLPFWSSYTRIINNTGVALYYDLIGGTLSTSQSATIAAAGELTISAKGVRVKEISLTTTSTAAGAVVAVVTGVEPNGYIN